MKNHILLFVVVAASVIGCKDYKAELDQAVAKSEKEKKELVDQANAKDSTINSFVGTLNEIEENLATIKAKQSTISAASKSNPELKANVKDRINDDIRIINELMEENRQKIENLANQVKKSNFKIGQFQKTIAKLNQQLATKDTELVALNTQLETLNTTVAKLNTSIDTLTANNDTKSRRIEEQTKKLNTAYYTLGTYKDLKAKQVLNKEGGILGFVNKDQKLKSDFNASSFTSIDITQTNVIPIQSKKAQIVTTHPLTSYKLERNEKLVKQLVITNPDEFWKASKYLVVVTE